MAGSTSTDVLARLARAARVVVDCDSRPVSDPGGCAFYAGDGHYAILKRQLEEAEAYLAELARRPS